MSSADRTGTEEPAIPGADAAQEATGGQPEGESTPGAIPLKVGQGAEVVRPLTSEQAP